MYYAVAVYYYSILTTTVWGCEKTEHQQSMPVPQPVHGRALSQPLAMMVTSSDKQMPTKLAGT
jgi:hypothetical protein